MTVPPLQGAGDPLSEHDVWVRGRIYQYVGDPIPAAIYWNHECTAFTIVTSNEDDSRRIGYKLAGWAGWTGWGCSFLRLPSGACVGQFHPIHQPTKGVAA